MPRTRIGFAVSAAVVAALVITACGGSDDSAPADTSARTDSAETTEVAAESSGIEVVSPDAAASTIATAPDELVILDVRTQEEYDAGHIEGAVLLDFYRDDFADELATFDPDVPYVLYCRSGNRSSGARAIMADLGFGDVEDVDGGIVAWQRAGLPTVTG